MLSQPSNIKEKFERPEYYANEKVRGEVLRNYGYFMTESSGHLSEYVPWFRKNKKAFELYCDEPSFGGETGAYYRSGISLFIITRSTYTDTSFKTAKSLPVFKRLCPKSEFHIRII